MSQSLRRKKAQLRLRFHAVGNHRHAELVAHGDDGARNRRLAAAGRCALDEAAVDLEPVHRVAHQRAQAGIAGAEVVQAQADAFVAQIGHRLVDEIDVVGQRAFVDLQRDELRRHTGGLQHRHHFVEEARAQQLQRGNIHCNAEIVETLVSPQPRLAHCVLQYPFADLHDHAQALGGTHEAFRHQHAQGGRLPAQQRFHAHDAAVARTHQRLIAQAQFAVRNRIDDLPRNDAFAMRVGGRVARVQPHRVAAFARGLVAGFFGVIQQRGQ